MILLCEPIDFRFEKELAHNRERSNSNSLKPCKGVLLYPHDTRTMRLTQPITPGKGVLTSTVPNMARSLNLTPRLRVET